MLAIGLMSLRVVLVVPSLRRQFVGRMKSAWVALLEQAHNAKGALDVLRHPKNVMQMLGGNLVDRSSRRSCWESASWRSASRRPCPN